MYGDDYQTSPQSSLELLFERDSRVPFTCGTPVSTFPRTHNAEEYHGTPRGREEKTSCGGYTPRGSACVRLVAVSTPLPRGCS